MAKKTTKEKEHAERRVCTFIDTVEEEYGTGQYGFCEPVEKIDIYVDEDGDKTMLITFEGGKRFQGKMKEIEQISFKLTDILVKDK